MNDTSDIPVESVSELLDYAKERFADLPAFTQSGASLTYHQLWELSEQFAAFLHHHTSLKPGDRLIVLMPNLLQFPVAFFGAIRAGMIVVTANPFSTAYELEHLIKDSGAKGVVTLTQVLSTLSTVLDKTDIQTVIKTDVTDLHPIWHRCFARLSRFKQPKKFLLNSSVDLVGFRSALALGKRTAFVGVQPAKDDIALLQYTGGTTGLSKGAILLHRNLLANMWQINDLLSEVIEEGEEIIFASLPLYHIYSLTLHFLVGVSKGTHIVLIPNPRNLDAFVHELGKYPFTILGGVNTLFVALSQHAGFQQLDFSHLKVTFSGGSALTPSTAQLWEQVTGKGVLEGYGLTEASPAVTANIPNAMQTGTVGGPLRDTIIKVLSEDGTELSYGEAGELYVKGPQVMVGYWNNPEETAQVLKNNWLATGDIARIDQQGNIQIVDRKKDTINVSGFTVYPNELEKVISSHPQILECAAIGLPDENGGEVIKLFVVSSNPRLSIREIRDYCRERLTSYKVPRLVEFRENLPHNAIGKVLRRQLRDAELAAQILNRR